MRGNIKTCVSLDSPKKLSKHCLRNYMWKIGSARSMLIPEKHRDFGSINLIIWWRAFGANTAWVGVPNYTQLTPQWEIRNRSTLPPFLPALPGSSTHRVQTRCSAQKFELFLIHISAYMWTDILLQQLSILSTLMHLPRKGTLKNRLCSCIMPGSLSEGDLVPYQWPRQWGPSLWLLYTLFSE